MDKDLFLSQVNSLLLFSKKGEAFEKRRRFRFVKERERERKVIVRRGAKSRTLEDSRAILAEGCTDRAKVIPAPWCAATV